jgi:hypothetical protein
VVKPRRYTDEVTQTVSAVATGRWGARAIATGVRVGVVTLSLVAAPLSAVALGRLAGGFFGGKRMPGTTATIIIKTIARMTRRSTVSP